MQTLSLNKCYQAPLYRVIFNVECGSVKPLILMNKGEKWTLSYNSVYIVN